MMTQTDKATFDAFVASHCTLSMIAEPRAERDTEYSYQCYDDADGNEVAFVTFHTGEEPTYHILEIEA